MKALQLAIMGMPPRKATVEPEVFRYWRFIFRREDRDGGFSVVCGCTGKAGKKGNTLCSYYIIQSISTNAESRAVFSLTLLSKYLSDPTVSIFCV
jgi:hypothetical protein